MKVVLCVFVFLILICNIAYSEDYYFSPRGAVTNTPSRSIHRYTAWSVQEAKKLSAEKAETEPFILCKTFFGEEQFYYRGQLVREEDLQELSRKEYEASPEFRAQQFVRVKESQKSEYMTNIIVVVVLVFLILSGIGIWAGFTDRAIFFHSMLDVIISFIMIIGIPIVMIFIWQQDNNKIPILTRHLITWPILSGAIIYQLYQSVRYTLNKPMGVCVFFGRLLIAIIGILAFLSRPRNMKDDPYGHRLVADTMIWMALVAGIAYFIRRLINKDIVLSGSSDREVEDALRIQNKRYSS